MRKLSVIAGISYFIIFFAAIFANFFVLESISKAPLVAIQENDLMVRFGIMAFILTVVFDVVVAWALYELYKNHVLSSLSTLFRMMHAAVMGVAIYALVLSLKSNNEADILFQVSTFNTIWLIGLFFFGIHLILLSRILKKPKFIAWLLIIAGIMYIVDTSAHFLLANYDSYSHIFLMLVAIPSIIGEMSFAVWLLRKKSF
ncbi:DUF4386 domain-containing protein [Mangrovimonas sp. AS39]|uniref:DUF4386 domain-containing protein n=1 Tax=Mangrovimonas futianensis TaxID=2895523 RepID=UPI001E39ED2C|nr:DUF4386 domain-containing protein [Mangrovimonas futianensis]MCF1192207.1 DUF4386 domain-containing protein [Mangrovimonas futianensis]MCF1196044.1 DUF4386 domain-containing protein [Mangrovimonas futianensis]